MPKRETIPKPSNSKMPGEGKPMEAGRPTSKMPGEGTFTGTSYLKGNMPSKEMVAATMLTHAKPTASVYSILVPRDTKEGEITRELGLVGDTQRGSTAHFNVFFDSSLGTDGITISDAILQVCEADFLRLQGYFGGITPSGLPFNIHVTTGSNGASHATCAATDISIGGRSAAGVNIAFMRSLVIAEEDEVFEAVFGHGWDCGRSNGEGLSRGLGQCDVSWS